MCSRRAAAVWLASLLSPLFVGAAPCLAGAPSTPQFSAPLVPAVGVDPLRVAVGDLNADGKPDLATADWTSSTVSVLIGTGNGDFEKRSSYPTARHPSDIAVADLDGDGDADVAALSHDRAGTVAVFLNDGTGRIVRTGTHSTGPDGYGIAAADLDGDGAVDLATAHYNRSHLLVLAGTGGGRFIVGHSSNGPKATDVAIADLNGDGKADLALAAGPSRSLVIRFGLGDGSFGAPTAHRSGPDPYGIALADFNHDAALDIAVANYGDASVSVFLATGGGSFGTRTRYPMGEWDSDAVVAADFDGDGHVDIAAPDLFGPTVRRGRGDGTFGARQPVVFDVATWSGAVADFNGDGRPDLAFAARCDLDCSWNRVAVYLNWTLLSAPPCVVPDVEGVRLLGATRSLRSAGCRLGEVRHRSSRTRAKGIVIAQRSKPETVLPNRSEVDVVVSRGRRRQVGRACCADGAAATRRQGPDGHGRDAGHRSRHRGAPWRGRRAPGPDRPR